MFSSCAGWQQREMVNDNTIVFHVELILPGERNVVELLRDEGYVELHQPVILPGEQNLVQLLRDEEYVEVDQSEPQLSVADDDDGSTVGEASVADASASLGILIPRSPLSEAPECNARLSAKWLVCILCLKKRTDTINVHCVSKNWTATINTT